MAYIGEIRMFGGNFAPVGWMLCQGQTLPISDNDTLFNLIGTTYGGDGQNDFKLPDLTGRTPIHAGQGSGLQNYTLAQNGGLETVALSTAQLPAHTHNVSATATSPVLSPQNAYFGTTASSQAGVNGYATTAANTPLAATSVSASGGSQPHTNWQPSLGVNFIISMFGEYPSQ